jgi:hypothetical protein
MGLPDDLHELQPSWANKMNCTIMVFYQQTSMGQSLEKMAGAMATIGVESGRELECGRVHVGTNNVCQLTKPTV